MSKFASESTRDVVLERISQFLLWNGAHAQRQSSDEAILDDVTEVTVKLCRSVLPSILHKLFSARPPHGTSPVAWSERVFCAVSKIVSIVPSICDLALDHFQAFGVSPFDRLAHNRSEAAVGLDLALAKAAHTFARHRPESFSNLWNWSPVLQLLSSSDRHTRWNAAQSLALVFGLTEFAKASLMSSVLSTLPSPASTPSSDNDENPLVQGLLSNREAIDEAVLWLQSLHDRKRPPAGSRASTLSPSGAYADPLLVDIEGVFISRSQRAPAPAPLQAESKSGSAVPLIRVECTRQHLRTVALALSQGQAILLEGPMGSGKTALVEECARLAGHHDMVRIYLDDQIDSKTLLGTHTCTDTPGEFQWRAGALTQAVQEGRWVLIEDVDHAPFEVLSALVSLLERRVLFLPGRGETIHAAPGFQLFATRTCLWKEETVSEITPFLHAHFSRVHVTQLQVILELESCCWTSLRRKDHFSCDFSPSIYLSFLFPIFLFFFYTLWFFNLIIFRIFTES